MLFEPNRVPLDFWSLFLTQGKAFLLLPLAPSF